MNDMLYIVWDVDPTMFTLGSFELRYYGLMWVLALLLGERIMSIFAYREGYSPKIIETGFVWIILGAILGARIGHCLFYEFDYYITKPWAMLTEIRNGGMASHGSAIGMLLGMWITSRKCKMPYIWWLDRLMIPVAIGGMFVRLGNLLNSEIVGSPTTLPWGFKFMRLRENWGLSADAVVAQHPTQLYEAICYLITFFVLVWLYFKEDMARRKSGVMFGVGVLGIFLTRFFIELVKLDQEEFEAGMLLNMGQLLSIPFIVMAIWCIWKGSRGGFPIGMPTKFNKR
jgi:prolipoprotein diacylglyceryl transferase